MFWTMTILSIPVMSRAMRCSFVWGWGQGSLAAMIRTAPSMMAAPESIVAIRVSWPGESTKDTVLRTSLGEPQTGQVFSTVYASGAGQFGHLLKVASA